MRWENRCNKVVVIKHYMVSGSKILNRLDHWSYMVTFQIIGTDGNKNGHCTLKQVMLKRKLKTRNVLSSYMLLVKMPRRYTTDLHSKKVGRTKLLCWLQNSKPTAHQRIWCTSITSVTLVLIVADHSTHSLWIYKTKGRPANLACYTTP